MPSISITVEIDNAETALQLAQFCKRSTFYTFYEMTEPHLPDHERKARAYQMIYGIDLIQGALARAGIAPR